LANLNRENLIKVDIKNATVSSVDGNMTFYTTDKKTCNIFCQLVTNKSSNPLIKDYIPIENARDYRIMLRVVKPGNEPKELEFTLLKQLESEAFFMVDLTDEYKDKIGTYKCEIFIISNTEKESGEIDEEIVTTNSFTYRVNGSIMNDLDDIIDDGSDNPLINILATKEYVDDLIHVIDKQYITADDFPMGNSTCKITGTIVINGTSGGDLTNFNNHIVYAQKVKGIGGLNFLNIYTMDNKYFHFDFNEGSVKLYVYEYITKDYMAEELENLTQGIATVDYVDESIAAIPDTDLLINYTTESDVRNMIQRYNDTIVAQDFASKSYVNSMMLSMDQKIEKANYTTESFVNEEISKLSANISNILTNNYATKSEMNTAINETLSNTNLSNYTTYSYVHNYVSGAINGLDDRYATTSYVDTEVDEVFKYSVSVRNMLQNVIDEYATQDYVNTAIANAQLGGSGGSVDLSDYATHTYVSNFFNTSINDRLVDYATKEYVGDEIRELSNSMLNYSDIKDYMADYLWTNEYTTKDDVAEQIANAQLGGGEGGSVDTDNLAITNSLTVGSGCTASGKCSMAQGIGCNANTNYSHAEGYYTTASGEYGSHSEGERTTASGYRSHAEGWNTTASGTSAHAEGYKTIAASKYQHVQGKYNIEDTEDKYAHIVGNGTKDESNNAHTLDWSGNAWYQGDVYVGGTSQDDGSKLATESYVNEVLGDIETLLGEI
jgi:hypothetical protein